MSVIQVLDFESYKAALIEPQPPLDEHATEEEERLWRRTEQFLYERYQVFLDNGAHGRVIDSRIQQVLARPVFERRADGLYPVDLQNIPNPAFFRLNPSTPMWVVEPNIIEPPIVESTVVGSRAVGHRMSRKTAWAVGIEVALGFLTLVMCNLTLMGGAAGLFSMIAIFFWGTIVAQTVWMDLPKNRARHAARLRGEYVPSIGPTLVAATIGIAVVGHEYNRRQKQRQGGSGDLRAMSAEYTRNVLGNNQQP